MQANMETRDTGSGLRENRGNINEKMAALNESRKAQMGDVPELIEKREAIGKSIKHNAVTFKLFDQLKLNAPTTTDDIPALLEKLEEQLAGFQEKVKEWELSRDEMKAKILAGEDVVEKAEEKAAGGEEAKEE